ncbi:hypothetical protein BCV69DRAFT_48553 [Microstroma glucosiphilum]|uniref:Uncharacterized protein n=1 Tax=Pseudomicrostroma glucosiphilum TaxID=1684307 RepID=A0A316U1I3_9BASI|nr:hypothetical protein BCV69DRAFT_48553 [Pseudomicrostroma glucosiphilum]PWN19246.1 hypothetical protein BCV69DRAFT_48553 [Pseudomicrostroma glucosiphilum]
MHFSLPLPFHIRIHNHAHSFLFFVPCCLNSLRIFIIHTRAHIAIAGQSAHTTNPSASHHRAHVRFSVSLSAVVHSFLCAKKKHTCALPHSTSLFARCSVLSSCPPHPNVIRLVLLPPLGPASDSASASAPTQAHTSALSRASLCLGRLSAQKNERL